MRCDAESMSCALVNTSKLPARNVTGTSMLDSGTRACSRTLSASLAYQAGWVVKNSCSRSRSSAVSAAGLMMRLRRSMLAVRLVHGSLRVSGATGCPATVVRRAKPVISTRATGRGTCSGANMVENVFPGTPATARMPETRSGCRTASSKAIVTPTDHAATTAASTPASSITAIASSTKASRSTLPSTGRAEPPVPRWFQPIACTPQSGRSSAGQAHGLVPSPFETSTVGPSASLVQARNRVPSALVTS
jgi:hypothetical protein